MNADEKGPGRKRLVRIFIAVFLVALSIVGIFAYTNFNRLLSEALMRSFNSSIVSDVYELKFEELRLNLLEGSIRVFNASLQPREKPLRRYPYVNSSFWLTTDKITLKNVQILDLLRTSRLSLERISIYKPEVELLITGAPPILMPFKDTTATAASGEVRKRAIDSFILEEFQLIDASFHVTNSNKQREFRIQRFNISLRDLLIRQQPAEDLVFFRNVELSIGEFTGKLKNGGIKRVGLKDFKIGIDSLETQMTVDTLIYHFHDFNAGLKSLDIQTADSLFHLTLGSFKFSYKDKSIKLSDLSFKPNISDAAMQERFAYQHTQVSGTVGTINMVNVNFDSLIYRRGLFIDEISVDKSEVSIFKDNTKPVDANHLPIYFGQQVKVIPLPLRIKKVNATNVHLVNTERKRDGSYAKVTLHRGTAQVKNITNLSAKQPLTLSAEAFLVNNIHFNLTLGFSYSLPQFTINGKLEKFNLPDINPVIQAYTPAKINAGTADEIAFSGTVYRTNSTGTMKFLYHDLEVDLELRQKAKWKNDLIAFAANTYLNSANPGSRLPPRVVQYHVERDMHKGFINIVLKSVLMGVKETLIMSKENRKAYKDEKKRFKKKLD